MDIIVIEHPNGHFYSSPFHARFSSKQVINSENVDILIYINGKKKDLTMKLAKSGDAYFIPENINHNIYSNNEKNSKKNITLIPSEDQIKLMELKKGKNSINFVIKSPLSGIQSLKSYIYLWPSDTKLILWDIDGTITKSDILGVILPRIGINWNHENVVDLINKLYFNGYKIIYLTARAIFQSEATHYYLSHITQKNKKLPPGPVIMDPDGVFSSFKKGIIQKEQYMIKILSLIEIKKLFGNKDNIFYAGFGNKETDAIAYRYLGIDLKNIFIIDIFSEITRLGIKNKTTYSELSNNCDEIFPKVNA